ncbi:STAS domain-containing protein [Geodermatophilus sp. SYSU D00815]
MSTPRPTSPAESPSMTEVVDPRRGSVRVSGHLTVQGADLVRGTVESLRRSGHARVLVDLQDVQAVDAAGLHVLRDVARSLAEGGGVLVLEPGAGARPR